jgi:hypothetical protein
MWNSDSCLIRIPKPAVLNPQTLYNYGELLRPQPTHRTPTFTAYLAALVLCLSVPSWASSDLHLTEHDVLETHGLSILLFHNSYHHVFGDQKMSGLEIILQEQRIATNGDVRLSPTPAQRDSIPDFQSRKRGAAADEVTALCTYADRGLTYRIDVRPEAYAVLLISSHYLRKMNPGSCIGHPYDI